MDKKNIELFLQDLSVNTKYSFLEVGKDDSELEKIAKKHKLKTPCRDIAIFKGTYGFVDRTNKNGCDLPKEDVKVALQTLNGKAVDLDHLRKNVVGYWLEGELEGDTINSYGVFWKGNFKKEYENIKGLMEKGTLGISFEAWGKREYKEDGTYSLRDIEFSGGALLPTTNPAFDGAEVLEMANVKAPETYLHLEKARLSSFQDIGIFFRMAEEVPYDEDLKMTDWREITLMDFENSKMHIKYFPSGRLLEVSLKPNVTVLNFSSLDTLDLENFEITFEELEQKIQDELECSKELKPEERKNLKDESFAVIKTVKNKKTGKSKKIRMFPIHDESHVRNALARLAQAPVAKTLEKLGVSVDSVKKKILKRAKELNMDELVKKYEEATVEAQVELYRASVKEAEELKATNATLGTELATVKETLATKETELATVIAERDAAKAEIASRDKAIEDAKVAERQAQLGDFGKDMTREDVLNEDKFTIAMQKKEIADLKAKKPETASAPATLEKGSADKNLEGKVWASAKKVNEIAFKNTESEE